MDMYMEKKCITLRTHTHKYMFGHVHISVILCICPYSLFGMTQSGHRSLVYMAPFDDFWQRFDIKHLFAW